MTQAYAERIRALVYLLPVAWAALVGWLAAVAERNGHDQAWLAALACYLLTLASAHRFMEMRSGCGGILLCYRTEQEQCVQSGTREEAVMRAANPSQAGSDEPLSVEEHPVPEPGLGEGRCYFRQLDCFG